MANILEDRLTDNWEEEQTTPKKLVNEVIQEFKNRYPEFIRTMNR